MNRRMTAVALSVGFGLACLVMFIMPRANAQGSQSDVERMLDAALPSEHHARLKPLAGDWTVAIRMSPLGDVGPTTTVEGSSSIKWVMGGRFLVEDSEFNILGDRINGMSIVGHDNIKGHYVMVSLDSSSTAVFVLQGKLNDQGTAIIFEGMTPDPMTQVDAKTEIVLHLGTKDSMVQDIYQFQNDKKVAVAKATYTRR